MFRTNKEFFFEFTKVRNQQTLHEIVQKHVVTGSSIITDELRGYIGLKDLFTSHKTICHKKYFVHPQNRSIHTQTIESMWGQLKKYVKNYGTNIRKNLKYLILEFKFKSR